MACSLGGIVACGATHTAVTPLDVVKCNMQTDPKNYTGIVQVRALLGWRQGLQGLGGLLQAATAGECSRMPQHCWRATGGA